MHVWRNGCRFMMHGCGGLWLTPYGRPIGYLPAANTPIDIFYHCVDRFGAWSLENTAILQAQSSMMASFIHNHNIYRHQDVNI